MFYHTSIIPKCHQTHILYDQHNEGNESLQSEEAYGIERGKKKVRNLSWQMEQEDGWQWQNLFKSDGLGVIALVMDRKVGKALDEKGATKGNWTWSMWSTCWTCALATWACGFCGSKALGRGHYQNKGPIWGGAKTLPEFW